MHELGHVLQMREMGISGFNCYDDMRDNDEGHTMVSEEWDKLSTAEGWADYVAAAAWWIPDNSSSDPKVNGFKIEKAAPRGGDCALASRKELQVAKGFWDLDDTNAEAADGVGVGDDASSFPTLDLLDFWGNFAPGTLSRQASEASFNGANVWDYQVNASLDATQSTTFISHNCLGAQAP